MRWTSLCARAPQYNGQQAVQLTTGTADTAKLIAAARRALGRLWKSGYSYKKAGVVLLDVTRAEDTQPGLFVAPDDPRSHARMAALDAINARFGREIRSLTPARPETS